MTQEIMTAEQGFIHSMNTYPSLYTASTLDEAKMKYFDHIFNVIGNGYRDVEEFLEAHTITEENKNLIDSFPEKYIGDTPLFYGYTKVTKHRGYENGVFGSELPGIYTEEELKDLPQVVYTVQANGHFFDEEKYIFNPYPNFSKQYSMIWEENIDVLDISWFKAAKFYYQNAKEFFDGENAHKYHGACPQDEYELEDTVNTYNKAFETYRKEGMTEEEYHAAVSKAYELEYKGDTKQFIQDRWEKEHVRIKEFIDETLERVEGFIAKKEMKTKLKM